MRIKALTLATAFLSAGFALSAQENDTNKTIRYSHVTEFGFISAHPKGISLEVVTVQGFSIHKMHHLGLGLGMGGNSYAYTEDSYGYSYSYNRIAPYMPVFLNYRHYFKPNKVFSPHVNFAFGGLLNEDLKGGMYSVITGGFKAGKFSFSSGLSLMAITRYVTESHEYWNDGYWVEGRWSDGYWIDGYWTGGYWSRYSEQKQKRYYPFGLVVKVGFTL